jgi:Ca2+-binding EF-hand superfamily protein
MEYTMTKFLLGGAIAASMAAFAPATAQTAHRGQIAQAPLPHHAAGGQAHSRAQLGAHVQSMFARLDTDRDGFITRVESDGAKGARGNRQAMQSQRRNGRAPEQRAADRGTMFERIDANRDGMLSRDEFARAPGGREQRVAAAGGQNRRQRHAAAGGKQGSRDMGMAGLRGRMFEMADLNRDTRVSLQEATAAAYRHFDMTDANRDGQVTRDERLQARQRVRAERNPG